MNTNKYGALMQNQNTVYCKFQGRFTLHVSRRDYKYVYSYPVEICFYKTGLNEKVAKQETEIADEKEKINLLIIIRYL